MYIDVFSPAPRVPPLDALLARLTKAGILDERNRRISIICSALATAFGGVSQVEYADMGRAVAGQIVNGGLGCYGTAEELCALVYEGLLYRGEPDYDAVMPTAVGECLARAGDCSGLPHKHYVQE